jgi:HPt (histidine-containing phosphotransfer) domain-containing protein
MTAVRPWTLRFQWLDKKLMYSGADIVLDHRAAPPPAAVGMGPIDRTHLARYTGGDQSLEHEILDLFVGQIPATIHALKCAQTDRDWHLFAHTLKGSGRAVGAWRLADLAVQAEALLGNRDPSTVAVLIGEIEAAAADVAAYIGGLRQTAR